jgi:hypothetical protein
MKVLIFFDQHVLKLKYEYLQFKKFSGGFTPDPVNRGRKKGGKKQKKGRKDGDGEVYEVMGVGRVGEGLDKEEEGKRNGREEAGKCIPCILQHPILNFLEINLRQMRVPVGRLVPQFFQIMHENQRE